MKKIVLSTLIFLLGFNICFAQEKLVDLLKNLSVKNKVINTKQFAEGSNYFELMQNKKNFLIEEHDYIAYYINSYKNFSIYQLAWTESYTEEMYKEYYQDGIAEFRTKFALLFDNKKKRCYMIKYSNSASGGRDFRVESIDRYNKISVEISDFDVGINSILRLDENFQPLYGTILESYIIDGIDREDDEFVALFDFKECNDTIYQILLKIPPISINEVTIVEFFKLFSDEHGYSEYVFPKWREYDMEGIFGPGGMF